MPYNALYYPYIDPPNRATLATAMLYWDRLYTIVPSTLVDPYKLLPSRAAASLGFLYPRHVSSDTQRSRLPAKSSSVTIDVGRWFGTCALPSYAHKTVQLHLDKITDRLHRGILRSRRANDAGFLPAPAGLVMPYMSRLASVITKTDRIALFTDRTRSQQVAIDRFWDKTRPNPIDRNEALLANLSFEAIRMSPDTHLHELWGFRQDHYQNLNGIVGPCEHSRDRSRYVMIQSSLRANCVG